MKKLFSLAITMILLLSCFAINASAEGVNVASAEKGATYSYDFEPPFFGAFTDDNCALLNDGIVPTAEIPDETVAFQGTGVKVMLTIDLGAFYTDITDINFLCVCDSLGDQISNRGFSGEKTKLQFSTDGASFERNKDFEMSRVDIDDITTNSFYNFCFKFNAPVSARYIKIDMNNATGYILSLGEIEVISASGEGQTPAEPESSDEVIEESSDEALSEEATSEIVSEETSAEETSSEESKAEESKAEESKAEESKAENSSQATEEDGGVSPLLIVGIVVAVIAVAAVVVVVLKKKKQ